MCQQARRIKPWLSKLRFVCGDIESLPFADASADMIFSNLCLQWARDLDQTFAEFRRVLKADGVLMFTTFGPDTLKELRHSWAQVDDRIHVNSFIDMHDIGDALLRAGLSEPVMDVEQFTLTYPDVRGLMRDLKQVGAHNVTQGRRRSLTGKSRLSAMQQAYEGFRQGDVLPASYEVVYGHAWIGATARPSQTEVPVDTLFPPSSKDI
jgi:malonyl-CoA O-methyltransferase